MVSRPGGSWGQVLPKWRGWLSRGGNTGCRSGRRRPRRGARPEPLAAAISCSLCDSRSGEGAGYPGRRRSRGGWGGGAEGGAQRGCSGAEPGRASCAPARATAVGSGRSPRPAADPGKRCWQALGPAWGLGCCWGWRRGRKNARGAGTPSPSPGGVLSTAAGLARPGGPRSPRRLGLRPGTAPCPLWPTLGPAARTPCGRR